MQHETVTQTNTQQPEQTEETTCCIVGGGPAGAILALLLARKGVPVMLLEEHMDFDRAFRGDTIHPSVMEILDEIGIAERLLQLDHTKVYTLPVQTAKGTFTLADLREKLIVEDGYIHGVHYRGRDGWHQVRAVLTVGADGRFSRIRKLADFEPIKTAPPMDVLWFRVPRNPDEPKDSGGVLANGHILIKLNRGDEWQVGYVIAKGGYQEIHAAGIEKLRQEIAQLLPEFADRMQTIHEWKQVSVLSVESSRLRRWYRPGLLLIGDAAHVMSPVGGVGINYAIQDATAAANVLAGDLKAGKVSTRDLAKVQRKREWQTRIIQGFQNIIQKQVLKKVLTSNEPLTISPVLLFLLRLPLIRNLPARFIGIGPWPAHVRQDN